MSYDLCFWKQTPGLQADPRSTYLALIEGRPLDGIEPFAIDDFLARVETSFPEARRDQQNGNEILWLDADDALIFEISWSRAHVLAMLRTLDDSVANRLIDVALSVDAPLYDPQVDERFAAL